LRDLKFGDVDGPNLCRVKKWMLVPHLLKIYFGLGSLSSVLEIVSSQLPSRCITEVFTELKSAVRSELITKLPVLLGCRVPLALAGGARARVIGERVMGGLGGWNALAAGWPGPVGGRYMPYPKILIYFISYHNRIFFY